MTHSSEVRIQAFAWRISAVVVVVECGTGKATMTRGRHSGPYRPDSDAWGRVLEALASVPRGLFVMTASHDGVRAGWCARWVQQIAGDPPCVAVALRKGHPISPLVRDARCFGLCQVSTENVYLSKRFVGDEIEGSDPFAAIQVETLVTGAPMLTRAMTGLDCRVTMHIDFEADCELYIAQVLDARVYREDASPFIEPSVGNGEAGGAGA